jgi:putative flavoprotein involved in K+ transport
MTTAPSLDVLVIGAGQAGLALGYHLARTGATFLLVDAAPEVGASWRSRWDSLRLFSPAQYDSLPGMPFPAPTDSHPSKDEVADYLAAYADRFRLPIRLSTPVLTLRRDDDGWFTATTPTETLRARAVVVATGPFHVPHTPALAAAFAPHVLQLHSAEYRNPAQLPAGAEVLVVGAANSGMQIAMELAERCRVSLAVGSMPLALPQRIAGRDLFFWLVKVGFFALPAGSGLARRLRKRGDLVIGSSRRRLRRSGITLRPRLTGASGTTARFADGRTADTGAVVWATGFEPDYSWLQVPGVVVQGAVRHDGGRTEVPGLSFLGLSWQTSRGSALLGFVGADAAALAARLTAEVAHGPDPHLAEATAAAG